MRGSTAPVVSMNELHYFMTYRIGTLLSNHLPAIPTVKLNMRQTPNCCTQFYDSTTHYTI